MTDGEVMQNGTIIKGIGGFYYVDIGEEIVECKARGHFRKDKIVPCVGDRVDISVDDDGMGAIDSIGERKNIFIRPPVANIDALVVVVSLKNPSPDLGFLDKMLAISRFKNVDAVICFNKSDLDTDTAEKLLGIYNNAGYKAFASSTVTGAGIENLKTFLKGKTTAFSGFSGVGKSSLVNCVKESGVMETGEISQRLKRGKHTTRHVELIKYSGGYIVDTPGFSMLDFPEDITKDELMEYFPEFDKYRENCKFRDCNHLGSSAVCAVSCAVSEGNIPETRYKNYIEFYKQLSQRKEWKK